MASAGGITYENFKNIKSATNRNTLGNDAAENLYIKMPAGSWTSVRGVDFGAGAKYFKVRTKGTGKLELRLGSRTASASATVEFASSIFKEYTIEVDDTRFAGVKTVFFVFKESTNDNAQFDAWQFYDDVPDAIETFHSRPSTSKDEWYDLSGRKVNRKNDGRLWPHGIYVTNGKKVIR